MPVVERGRDNALADFGDRLGNGSNALLIFRRKKKRAQERAVDTVAKGELGLAHALEQILGKRWHSQKCRLQNFVPFLLRRRRCRRRCGSARHFVVVPDDPAGRVAVAGAACVFAAGADGPPADCAAAALFGAPVKPAAAPIPSISSQRGHGFVALPFTARSTASRAIFSTTISK